MTTASTLARLKAWGAGAPSPAGAALPWPRARDEDILVLAFVRMAGESSPWGVAVGRPDQTPAYFSVPEPRNLDAHALFVRAFGKALLEHVLHPTTLSDAEREGFLKDPDSLRKVAGRRQLWVPGPTHLDMLHFVDYRYTLTRTGDEKHLRELRATGRAAGWLFRESMRPGQVRVFDATARLRQAFVFPAEAPRQSHLGYLLGWLTAEGGRAEHLAAAAEAERLSVGITLDPDLERDRLEELVGIWSAARHKLTAAEELGKAATALVAEQADVDAAAAQIHAVLVPELERRWKLAVRALRLLVADPRPDNPQLALVVELGEKEYLEQFWNDEARVYDPSLPPDVRRPFGNHPETDFSPVRAAFRYFMHLHAHELSIAELVHGDPALVDQAIDSGSAFRGTVTAVVDESAGRAMKAVWTMQGPADDSLRLREESSVCLVGARKRKGKIRSIDTAGDTRTVVVEIVDGKTGQTVPDGVAADSPSLVGREVVWLDSAGAGLSLQKTFKLGSSGPGAWLTHATPAPAPSPPGPVRPDLLSFVESLK